MAHRRRKRARPLRRDERCVPLERCCASPEVFRPFDPRWGRTSIARRSRCSLGPCRETGPRTSSTSGPSGLTLRTDRTSSIERGLLTRASTRSTSRAAPEGAPELSLRASASRPPAGRARHSPRRLPHHALLDPERLPSPRTPRSSRCAQRACLCALEPPQARRVRGGAPRPILIRTLVQRLGAWSRPLTPPSAFGARRQRSRRKKTPASSSRPT